jgi:AcrR family transcriptional regulator
LPPRNGRSETPGLRDRKRAATRAVILQTATRLFAERGYDSVTVEEVAEACALSPRTFFRYFASKEDVLFSGTEARRSMLLHVLKSQPADAAPFQAIAGASRMMAAHYLPDRELLRARARIIDSAPSLQARNSGLPQQWDGDVIRFLRSSGRAAGMDDLGLRLVVGASMTALRVSIETWITTESDLLELIDAAFRRLSEGFRTGARGTRRRAAS